MFVINNFPNKKVYKPLILLDSINSKGIIGLHSRILLTQNKRL